MFYTAFTRSLIDYASIFYGSATNTRLTKIDRLQYKALRVITGAFRSTPTQALLAETGEWPLNLRRLYLAKKFLIKNLYLKNDFLLKKVSKLAINNLTMSYWSNKNSAPLVDAFTDTSEGHNSFVKYNMLPFFTGKFETILFNVAVNYPQYSNCVEINNSVINSIVNSTQGACSIYTDGSKSANGVGCAFYIPSEKYIGLFRLNFNSSIFTAEANAIKQALDYIYLHRSSNNYVIFTDSMSCLKALEKRVKNLYTNPIIFEIYKILFDLSEINVKVSFVWVKGHAGVRGNDKADQLAKKAVEEGLVLAGLQYFDAFPMLKIQSKDKWKESYELYASNSRNHYTLVNKSLTSSPLMLHDRSLSRMCFTTVFRLIVGHGNSRYLLNKINLADSPLCLCDNTSVDTLNHWLFDCNFNQRASTALLQELSKSYNTPINVNSLIALSKLDKKFLNLVISFVRMCERKL